MPVMQYVASLFRDWKGYVGAGVLAGAILGAAVGHSLKRDPVLATRQVEDRSRPVYTQAVPEQRLKETVSYTFKRGDKAWKVLFDTYKPANDAELAKRVNEVAKYNAPKHKHQGNHLLKDTRAFVKGKLVKEGETNFVKDNILFDEIQAGDTIDLPGVERVILGKPAQPTGRYNTKPETYVADAGLPSKAGYGALLGALFGGLGGYGVYRLRRRGAEAPQPEEPQPQGPEGAGPEGPDGGEGPGGPEGGREAEHDLDLGGAPAERERVAPFPGQEDGQHDEPRNYVSNVTNLADFRGRKRLNDFEMANAGRDITQRYHGGMSVSKAVRDYIGLSTRDGYRMLAEEKLASLGTTYKWNRRLAEATGELSAVERMVLDGRTAGKSASQLVQEIKDATGFEMSRSTVYRMHKKQLETAREPAAA